MARRREQGSGSIFEYPKASGKWWVRMPDDGAGTPRKWRVNSKEEGRTLLRQKLRDLEDGYKSGSKAITVSQWIDHWLSDVIKPSVKATTHESYEQVCRLYITPYLASQRLDALRTPDVRKWVNTLGTKVDTGTVKNAYARLSAALNVAVDDELIRRNPCSGVKLPGGERRQPYAMTEEEANMFLWKLESHRLFALYYVAIATGMREGELLGLRWANVVLEGDKPEIRVREQLQSIHKKLQFVTPKSKNSKRDIPIDEQVVGVLRRHWSIQQAERLRLGVQWKEHGLVFPSEVGTFMSPRNLLRHFKQTLARAFLPENPAEATEHQRYLTTLRFHDLRHAAGSLMLAAGVPMVDVSKLLGHSSVAVTATIYAHSYEDNKRRAVTAVTKVLRRLTGS